MLHYTSYSSTIPLRIAIRTPMTPGFVCPSAKQVIPPAAKVMTAIQYRILLIVAYNSYKCISQCLVHLLMRYVLLDLIDALGIVLITSLGRKRNRMLAGKSRWLLRSPAHG